MPERLGGLHRDACRRARRSPRDRGATIPRSARRSALPRPEPRRGRRGRRRGAAAAAWRARPTREARAPEPARAAARRGSRCGCGGDGGHRHRNRHGLGGGRRTRGAGTALADAVCAGAVAGASAATGASVLATADSAGACGAGGTSGSAAGDRRRISATADSALATSTTSGPGTRRRWPTDSRWRLRRRLLRASSRSVVSKRFAIIASVSPRRTRYVLVGGRAAASPPRPRAGPRRDDLRLARRDLRPRGSLRRGRAARAPGRR